MGYDITLSPTKLYCEKLGNHILSLDEYRADCLDLKERLRLGLEISGFEKRYLDNLVLQLQKKVYR